MASKHKNKTTIQNNQVFICGVDFQKS